MSTMSIPAPQKLAIFSASGQKLYSSAPSTGLHSFSYHNQASLIITNYYFILFFPVGGTPYPHWNEWKVVYEIKVNKHRMSQPEHISEEL